MCGPHDKIQVIFVSWSLTLNKVGCLQSALLNSSTSSYHWSFDFWPPTLNHPSRPPPLQPDTLAFSFTSLDPPPEPEPPLTPPTTNPSPTPPQINQNILITCFLSLFKKKILVHPTTSPDSPDPSLDHPPHPTTNHHPLHSPRLLTSLDPKTNQIINLWITRFFLSSGKELL